ncbi:dihydrofolate reductase family protein [Pedobacter sp.]|uniref:dihydrofolate reductase family protein n=1 Tax=Pedobacter sp. TaxID=1411316 RepID=UPI003D7FCDBE
MRKLIFAINITLDGCYDHTKSIANDEVHTYFMQLLKEVDLLVYGRKTYELMVPFWPDYEKEHVGEDTAINEFAKIFNAINKVVFSQTLSQTDDKNTRLVHGHLEAEIHKLKNEPGKNILLGGITLSSQLIALNMIDEYYVVIHPIIAGEGEKLIGELKLQERLQLNLIDTVVLKSGFVALHYSKSEH